MVEQNENYQTKKTTKSRQPANRSVRYKCTRLVMVGDSLQFIVLHKLYDSTLAANGYFSGAYSTVRSPRLYGPQNLKF